MVTVCPSQFATRRTLFHVLVGCGLLMLKVSRLKLPKIGRAVQQECPRPNSYAVFCLKKKKIFAADPAYYIHGTIATVASLLIGPDRTTGFLETTHVVYRRDQTSTLAAFPMPRPPLPR